jgi:glycosyltransferase involved in cell wall biosynthesis
MKLEILISCMHQDSFDIVERSNIHVSTLIINQCNANKYKENRAEASKHIRMISTIEKGLSKSRNMALNNATGEICLLCDDDEVFDDNLEEIILEAFKKIPLFFL